MRSENMAKNCPNAVRLPKFEPVNGISWSPRKIMVKDLRQRSGLGDFAHAQRAAWSLTQGHTLFCQITPFLQRAQCSHCKRCISYSNSVCPSVRPSVSPSVCLSSVTRRYCLKTTARIARCSLHHGRIAKCVWFCRNLKIFPRGDPFALKFWLKVTYPLLKAASFDTFCLVAPQP